MFDISTSLMTLRDWPQPQMLQTFELYVAVESFTDDRG